VLLCFEESKLVVKGYVDLDFVGDLDKRKSTMSICLDLHEGQEVAYPSYKVL